MQEELLNTHKDAAVRVYAIWFSMYPTDRRDLWPADVLTDSRVMHFWDDQKAVGRWYGEHVEQMDSRRAPKSTGLGGPILWDAYLIYGPESRWDESPTDLRKWGRTILNTKDVFRETVGEVLPASPAAK